jgi:hypothetical protein
VRIVEEEEAKRVRIEVEKQRAVAIEKGRQKNARVALRQGKEEVEIGMKKRSDELRKSTGVLVGDRAGNLKLLSTWKLSAALNKAPQVSTKHRIKHSYSETLIPKPFKTPNSKFQNPNPDL